MKDIGVHLALFALVSAVIVLLGSFHSEAEDGPAYRGYPRRLAVRFARGTRGAHTALIGRGGMGLRCATAPALHALEQFEISLPETRDVVRVDGEVVYEQPLAGRSAGEVGVRFEAFPSGDESALIAWLAALEPSRP